MATNAVGRAKLAQGMDRGGNGNSVLHKVSTEASPGAIRGSMLQTQGTADAEACAGGLASASRSSGPGQRVDGEPRSRKAEGEGPAERSASAREVPALSHRLTPSLGCCAGPCKESKAGEGRSERPCHPPRELKAAWPTAVEGRGDGSEFDVL